MGGLSKKAFQYEKITANNDIPYLILDAGNLLFKHRKIAPSKEEQEKATAFGIVESYNLMGYDAVAISRQDLIAGLEFFKQITEASTFPWLSANFINKKSGKPLFSPSTIITKGTLNIGIIGLTSALPPQVVENSEQNTVVAWQKVLPDQISTLSQKCDMLVVLSNLSANENRQIAEKHKDIHIIIQSGGGAANLSPRPLKNTLICQTAYQGKYFGAMNINWKSTTWASDKPQQLKSKKGTLDRLIWKLGKYKKYKNPFEDLKNNPLKLRNYKNFLNQKQHLEKEIASLEKDLAEDNNSTNARSTYKNRFIALRTSLPDHKGVSAIVEKLNNTINRLGRNKLSKTVPMVSLESKYIGSYKCGSCHEEQFFAWKESRHAKAYNTLIERGQQFNLECLKCHITGNEKTVQGTNITFSKQLQAVGCENCHGEGKAHSNNPENVRLKQTPPAPVCLKCHNKDHDDSFIYDRDKRKIGCQPTV